MIRRSLNTLLLALGLVSLPACADRYPPTYSAEAITATVIDAETKKPLPGVIVTANWQLLGGMEGSYPVGQMEILETVTDQHGRFHFPAWGPKKRPKGYLREDDPQLLLFKPGYEYQRLANAVSSKINYGSVRRSEWNGKVIELRRFRGTMASYAESVSAINIPLRSMLEDCNWKRIPKFLLALKAQKDAFRAQGLQHSFYAANYVPTDETNCGSPEAFFRDHRP